MDDYAALLYGNKQDCSTEECEKSTVQYSGVYNSNRGTTVTSNVYTPTVPITFESFSSSSSSLLANDPIFPATSTTTTVTVNREDLLKDAEKDKLFSTTELLAIGLVVLLVVIGIIMAIVSITRN